MAWIQDTYCESIQSKQTGTLWCSKLIRACWTLINNKWKSRNSKLHNTEVIKKMEGHAELISAIKEEMKIGLSKLPTTQFAYLFDTILRITSNKHRRNCP